MDNYYADTAYDSRTDSFSTNSNIDEEQDQFASLSVHPACDQYTSCMSVSWPTRWLDLLHKKKRIFTTKAEIKREQQRHEKFFVKLVGDGAFFSGHFGILSLTGFYVFLILWPLMNWEFGTLWDWPKTFLEPGFLLTIASFYAAFRFFNYRVCNASDTYGITYNRRTGMVEYCNLRGEITRFPFTDCEAVTRREHYAAGGVYSGTYIRNKKTGLTATLHNGKTEEGVVAWTYIKEFMDISKPLADIAEVEDLRHLDPVTKAYDEKHPRERHYWRNQSKKETMAMEDKAKARAFQVVNGMSDETYQRIYGGS